MLARTPTIVTTTTSSMRVKPDHRHGREGLGKPSSEVDRVGGSMLRFTVRPNHLSKEGRCSYPITPHDVTIPSHSANEVDLVVPQKIHRGAETLI